MPPAIEFVNVSKVYRRRLGGQQIPALSDISFHVSRGEVCAFLGPNGAGKTTSMSILMGFLYADSGEIRVFDYAPGDVRAKQRIGFLPENFAFYKHLNAKKLLRFHLNLAGREVANPDALIADKAYDADSFVETLTERGISPVIPPKENRKSKRACDFALYCERNLVERFFNLLKHFRAIATRYDKLARNFLAGVQLGAITILLN